MSSNLARFNLQELVEVVHRFFPTRATRPPFTPLVKYRLPAVIATRRVGILALSKFHPTTSPRARLFRVRVCIHPFFLFLLFYPFSFFSSHPFLLFVLPRFFRMVFALEPVRTPRAFFLGRIIIFIKRMFRRRRLALRKAAFVGAPKDDAPAVLFLWLWWFLLRVLVRLAASLDA
mgnify:CR=1